MKYGTQAKVVDSIKRLDNHIRSVNMKTKSTIKPKQLLQMEEKTQKILSLMQEHMEKRNESMVDQLDDRFYKGVVKEYRRRIRDAIGTSRHSI